MSMPDPNMTLLYHLLQKVVVELESDPTSASAWSQAAQGLVHYEVTEADDEELALAIEMQDAGELQAIVEGWTSGKRLMLVRDRDALKRAMKAYRKRLKVTILAAESSLGGGPMSGGRKSTICGIAPPDRYPREVWDELVRQKRLVAGDRGTYELPPGG